MIGTAAQWKVLWKGGAIPGLLYGRMHKWQPSLHAAEASAHRLRAVRCAPIDGGTVAIAAAQVRRCLHQPRVLALPLMPLHPKPGVATVGYMQRLMSTTAFVTGLQKG